MKHWTLFPKKSDDIISQILINRGIELKDKDVFLDPNYERDLHGPFLLTGMKKAVKIILDTIKKKEKIGIFADYDADGIPGAAILTRTFNELKTDSVTYIPSRDEGYGLNEKGVRELYKNGCRLLITVDLGITGKKEVAIAEKLGMKVIVTDHHEIQKKSFPDLADVILHPDLSKRYPNKDLSGGAVAWKLACGLISKIKNQKPKTKNILKWLLDLAGISTICDMVPLIGENRVLAKYGLIVLSKTKNLGLLSLYNVAKIKSEDMSPYQVGWQIGPRINAPGRLDHASTSFYLLTTDNRKLATELAEKLNKINNDRQNKLDEVLKKAIAKVEKEKLFQERIIIVKGKDWPSGIVGLVASRITDKYHRPSIVFGKEGDNWRGSARSTSKFDIMKALEDCKKYLLGFGGHKAAAGLTVSHENYDLLYKKLCKYAGDKISDNDLIKTIKIDAEIGTPIVDLKLVDKLKKLEPHGLGNPKPVFLLKRLAISELRLVGKDEKHLKLKLQTSDDRRQTIEAIRFCEGNCENLKVGDVIDIVCNIDENIWRDVRKVDLKIVDLKKSN